MDDVWIRLRSVEGWLLGGIYGNRLDTFQKSNETHLYCVEPLLQFRKPNSSEVQYWKLEWEEDTLGDHILKCTEQYTPHPLNYEKINRPYQKHDVIASTYWCEPDKVEKVSGHGFRNEGSEYLTALVLKLGAQSITILASPVIEVRITNTVPSQIGSQLF
ncbi:hypothetical protein ACSVDE_00880 [Pseudalkalibacillus sp. Hm43]|uniref:hypothetical protein n=1 Tax=Pseudalkalibacillus sp. Hm43 TaxID=3450742 RepID=UPI003F430C3A